MAVNVENQGERREMEKIEKRALQPGRIVVLYRLLRGISAAGSAPHWQCGGQRFESAMLHGPGGLDFQGFQLFYFSRFPKLSTF